MNDSMYGKTMKKLRNRVYVRLAKNAKVYQKLVPRLCFASERYLIKIW